MVGLGTKAKVRSLKVLTGRLQGCLKNFMKRKRRSSEEIEIEREQEWRNLGLLGYVGFGICSKCGDSALRRGKRRNTMKCKGCFIHG